MTELNHVVAICELLSGDILKHEAPGHMPTTGVEIWIALTGIQDERNVRKKMIHHLLALENLDSEVVLQIVPLYQAAKEAVKVLEYEIGYEEADQVRKALEEAIAPLKAKLEAPNVQVINDTNVQG